MAEDLLKNILENLKLKIGEFSNAITPSIKSYREDLKKLDEIIIKIGESWSGSWIGFHSNLYYKGFKKPKWNESFDSEWGSIHRIPEYWEEKSYDDISSYINTNYKVGDILEIQNFLSTHVENGKELQTNLITELSLIRDFKNFDQEIKILEKIENIKWGISPSDFIKNMRPNRFESRDSFAMAQGIKIPPHILYQAKVLFCLSIISDIEDFIKLSKRLIRQIELKESIKREEVSVSDGISNVLRICKKFHDVATQLSHRYNKRPTLKVKDEYDVQDLLHSLLKIYFDDVRPEEWAPRYAGSASKIDFLLKKEKIVIEVKKTRKNLTDKQIGEQLLIDIAKYKQHPDCKTLICFIYDPEGKIRNPRGLEKDLNQMSNDDIKIITIITPF